MPLGQNLENDWAKHVHHFLRGKLQGARQNPGRDVCVSEEASQRGEEQKEGE